MELQFLLAIPVLVFTAWFYTVAVARSRFPTLRNKAIVLLIAHPDDEAMFFSPTVLGLTDPDKGNHVKILCLSNGEYNESDNMRGADFCVGNADGLGAIREKEIQQSGVLLGLRSATDVLVLDSPSFPDSMTKTWSASDISGLLNSYFTKAAGTSTADGGVRRRGAGAGAAGQGPPETTIDVLITFDRDGVSSHPNHCSLYHGAVAWVKSLTKGHAGWDSPIALYSLTSVNILRKYAPLLDAPWTMMVSVAKALGSKQRTLPNSLTFISDAAEYWTARKAMTQAHKSQMVWFRWGWITLGRYMVVNDLKRVNVH